MKETVFLASRVYAQHYLERRHPDKRSLQNLCDRFVRSANVNYPKSVKNRPARTEENQLAVLLSVTENPSVSQRAVADAVGVSESTVQRILKEHNFHAYHIQLHQELTEKDLQKRTNFSNWALTKIMQNYTFFDHDLFSDENTFHRNGFVNRHNFHYYSDHNPRIFRQIDHQHRWSINV